MNKGLEALKKIKNSRVNDSCRLELIFDKEIDIIEAALKDYEKRLSLAKENQDVDKIAKRLIALEIINEYNIDVYWLKISPNLSRYNLAVGTNQALKKDQYKLLKEVLK